MIAALLLLACAHTGEPTAGVPTAAVPTVTVPTVTVPTVAAPTVAAPTGAVPSSPAEEAALASAQASATRYATTLRERLVAAMTAGGPPTAVAVCSAEAPAVAATIVQETTVSVGRSSLRLRNPANAGPVWVQEWLVAQGERTAEGVAPMATVSGGVARVARPIVVEAPCLACHGPAETVAPEVRAVLAAQYPADRATGYALGDLRGVLWAEAPVTPN